MRRFSALLVAACILLFHLTASAQSEPSSEARSQASVRFKRGVELFQEEAYRAALIEFQRAYELAPDYRLLYNIGGTKLQLQDYLGAAQAYEKYLTEGGSSVPRERREEVEPALRSLQARVGRVAVTVNREADIYVDGEKVGTSPMNGSVLVNIGRHEVGARAADGASDTQMVDVAGDETAQVNVVLAPPRKDGPTVINVRSNTMRTMAVVGWGVGGAMLIGSVVTGVLAKNADSDLSDLLKRVDVPEKRVSDQRDTIKANALTTDILMIGGVAVAAAGTVLWFLDRRARREDDRLDEEPAAKASRRVEVQLGLGSAGLLGHF